MSDIAIRVECLTKQYTIETIQRRPNTLRDHLMNTMQRLRPPPPNGSTSYAYSALKDVSSEVKIR